MAVMPLLQPLDIKTEEVYVCSFTADGTRALTGAQGNPVQLWDVSGGRLLREFGAQSLGSWAVGWTEDQNVSFGTREGTVVVADGENGQVLHIFRGHQGFVRGIDIRHRTLVSASGAADGELMVWNIRTGECARKLEGHRDGVYSVALNAAGNRVLSGSRDGTVRVWDPAEGRDLTVMRGHSYHVQCVGWSSDERYAISCSTDIRMWDLEQFICMRVFEGHTKTIRSVVWSADQNQILSASYDATARIWDVRTGRCLKLLDGHGLDW